MRFGTGVAAVAGILALSCTAAAWGNPYAVGQQWRPSAGLASGQGPSRPHFANAPAFRPRPPVGGNHHKGYAGMPRYPSPPRGGRFAYRDARAHQPYANPAYAGYSHPPWPMPVPPTAAPPARGYPPDRLARTWLPSPPLFARQFAWRPAAQPWLMRAPAIAARLPYTVRSNPYDAHYRQPYAVAPKRGRWRPDPRQLVVRVYRYAGQQQSGRWAPRRRVASDPRIVRFAGFNPAANAMHRGSWRPGGQMRGAVPLNVAAFRPVSHGRGESASGVPASEGFHRARDALPGWVTSYQETDYAGACGWCDGG
mgnify:FL=1